MPELNLDELEQLAKAATPGPWEVEHEITRDSMGLFWPIFSIEGAEGNVAENVTNNDGHYIVAACNALPELIAENRKLGERVRELEAELEVYREEKQLKWKKNRDEYDINYY